MNKMCIYALIGALCATTSVVAMEKGSSGYDTWLAKFKQDEAKASTPRKKKTVRFGKTNYVRTYPLSPTEKQEKIAAIKQIDKKRNEKLQKAQDDKSLFEKPGFVTFPSKSSDGRQIRGVFFATRRVFFPTQSTTQADTKSEKPIVFVSKSPEGRKFSGVFCKSNNTISDNNNNKN